MALYTLLDLPAEYSTLSYALRRERKISKRLDLTLTKVSVALYPLRHYLLSTLRYLTLFAPRTEDILATRLNLDEGFRGSLYS